MAPANFLTEVEMALNKPKVTKKVKASKPAATPIQTDLDKLEAGIAKLFCGVEYRTFKHEYTPRQLAERLADLIRA